jgi:hypothetical protein
VHDSSDGGNTAQTMAFFLLLAPLAAMAFLTAMERVERWTDAQPVMVERSRPVRVAQSRSSVRATPTGQETPVPPIPQ